jgi:methylated-DNA-[protein]-cysteine S-methyltransferase
MLMPSAQASVAYVTFPTRFGEMAVAWHLIRGRPKVLWIFLPDRRRSLAGRVRGRFDGARPGSCQPVGRLALAIERCLAGKRVTFDLGLLDFTQCSSFQEGVLRAEYGIPRGSVSTYGRIARHLGAPRAPRAVGRALATNPFPIVIPCHRAVRSDGSLGGFRGGVPMKRALLEMEGVTVTPSGRVAPDTPFHY